MKRVLSAVLMVLSLMIGFQQAIIIMHFKLNQDAIEEQFCINKDTPELECHGACYLKKKLQKTENPDSASIRLYQKVDMLPISILSFEAKNPITEIKIKSVIYKEILYSEPYQEIFLPPPIA